MLPLLVLAAAPLQGQQGPVDRGVLLIMRGGEVIGREEFAVHVGATTATGPGYTVASTALYPAYRPEQSLTSVVEFSADSFPIVARLEVGDGLPLRVMIGIGPRRITVRRGSATTESAREYPARERLMIVDDSVFAPLAVRPPASAAPRRALALDGTLGESVAVRHRGAGDTRIGERTLRLDAFVITIGSETVTAWYDSDGRLQKVEWPQRGVTVVREEEKP
jgi:hypothetical protein